jgi:ribosome maturation factor RimP
MDIAERVRRFAEPLVSQRGLSLYDVQHHGGTLQVLVEGPDGVDLDQLAELTRVLSLELDESDPIPGRYTLEVSSPGLERKLRTPRHFADAVGETVSIKTVAGVEGDRRLRGIVQRAGGEGIDVVVVSSGEPRRLTYDQIERAHTVFEWPAANDSAPGSKKAARR